MGIGLIGFSRRSLNENNKVVCLLGVSRIIDSSDPGVAGGRIPDGAGQLVLFYLDPVLFSTAHLPDHEWITVLAYRARVCGDESQSEIYRYLRPRAVCLLDAKCLGITHCEYTVGRCHPGGDLCVDTLGNSSLRLGCEKSRLGDSQSLPAGKTARRMIK